MITINYGPVKSQVACDDPRERKAAFKFLEKDFTKFVNGFIFSPKYEMGLWDGCKHFFNSEKGTFPTGLIAKAMASLRGEFEVQVEGYPKPNPLHDTLNDVTLGEIKLRDYQLVAVRRVLKYHRGVLKIATNGGKTEICAGIFQLLGLPPSLFLIPRKEILRQTVERFRERLNAPIGIIGDGLFKPNYSGVNVAMFQTVNSRLKNSQFKKWYTGTRAVIGDECHFLRDERYQKAFEASHAELRLGVSGTPFPAKDQATTFSIMGTTGPVLCEVSNDELVERGVSVRPNIMFLEPKVDFYQRVLLGRESWHHALHTCEARNRLIAEITRALVRSGRQTVVMVLKVEHGNLIHNYIPEAMFAHADSGNRSEARKRLASGEVFPLICTSIFDTGLSVDYIEGIVYACGGKGDIKLPQSLGRGLRTAKDKAKDLWFVDLWDSFHDITKKHSRARYKFLQSQQSFKFVEKLSEAPPELSSASELVTGNRLR